MHNVPHIFVAVPRPQVSRVHNENVIVLSSSDENSEDELMLDSDEFKFFAQKEGDATTGTPATSGSFPKLCYVFAVELLCMLGVRECSLQKLSDGSYLSLIQLFFVCAFFSFYVSSLWTSW